MSLFCSKLLPIFFYTLLISPLISSIDQGFTVDIIRRNSPLSPFYNASMTHFERIGDEFETSLARMSSIGLATIDGRLHNAGGAFIIKAKFGTPPVDQVLQVDTGSDFTWIQCDPCPNCYKQKPRLFAPMLSSSYQLVPCNPKQCDIIQCEIRRCDTKNYCKFESRYGDGSISAGYVTTDTMSLETVSGNKVGATSFPKMVFGFAHIASGEYPAEVSGLLGLRNGPVSIMKQFRDILGGKLSQCLTPIDSKAPGKISFGSDAVVTEGFSTPLYTSYTFYYVGLTDVTIDGKFFTVTKSVSSHTQGKLGRLTNMILDLGATLSFLENSLYEKVEQAVMHFVKQERVYHKRYANLCFRQRGASQLNSPDITLVFEGRYAELKLTPKKNFVYVGDGVFCFAFLPSNTNYSILGNVHAADVRIGIDTVKNEVKFQPDVDCSKA